MAAPQPEAGPSCSFANVLWDLPVHSPCKIKPVTKYKGKPTVLLLEKDVTKMAEPFKHAIVGKFSHDRPNLEAVRKAFKTIGFQSDYTIGLLD